MASSGHRRTYVGSSPPKTDAREILVGIDQYNYNAARNTYAPLNGVTFRKIQRLPLDRIIRRPWAETSFVPLSQGTADILHTWNRINWGRRIWGVSFEDHLPRFFLPRSHFLTRTALSRLASHRCRFIIAISDFARNVLLSETPEPVQPHIHHKISVVYPHQPLFERPHPYQPPAQNQQLRVLFVGSDFFLKGGEAVLAALDALGNELDISCCVVSRVSENDFGSREVPPAAIQQARNRLSAGVRVQWRSYATPEEIRQLLFRSHLGILPTLQDSFGYVVLEYMAAGLPIVTTDVNALPEIVNERYGWRINIPKTDLRYWKGQAQRYGPARRASYREAIEIITAGLMDAFRGFRSLTPQQLKKMSAASVAAIQENFTSPVRTQQLLPIYRRALET